MDSTANTLAAWEKKSSIRSRPRRLLTLDTAHPYFFPINEQALCIHPLIVAMGESAMHYILIQSAYKFMGDIALIETEVVNACANQIIHDKLPLSFPRTLCHELLTVVIDETYHAYVAQDFIQQLEAATGVAPLTKITTTGLSHAIKVVGTQLPSPQREYFTIIAVCIGENSITKELVKITKDARVNKFFNEINADHTLDEGRHCGIFARVLTFLWQHLSAADKDSLSTVLPSFIAEYLKPDLQRTYNQHILSALALSPEKIDTIIHDTHIEYTTDNFGLINPIVDNINRLFEKTGVLSHPSMLNTLQQHGLYHAQS